LFIISLRKFIAIDHILAIKKLAEIHDPVWFDA